MAEDIKTETKAERRARLAAEAAAASATAPESTEATETVEAPAAETPDAEAEVAVEAEAPAAVEEQAPETEIVPETVEVEAPVAEVAAVEEEADVTQFVETETEAVETETEIVPESVELLELSQFKGDVIGSGSFAGAKAKALLEAVSHETATELDYVVISTSKANGFDRAVLVSPALFEKMNNLRQFSAVTKAVAWAVGGLSFSRDALFAGRVAYAITDARVGRVQSAAALAQGVTRVYGYIVSAADFSDSFAH